MKKLIVFDLMPGHARACRHDRLRDSRDGVDRRPVLLRDPVVHLRRVHSGGRAPKLAPRYDRRDLPARAPRHRHPARSRERRDRHRGSPQRILESCSRGRRSDLSLLPGSSAGSRSRRGAEQAPPPLTPPEWREAGSRRPAGLSSPGEPVSPRALTNLPRRARRQCQASTGCRSVAGGPGR